MKKSASKSHVLVCFDKSVQRCQHIIWHSNGEIPISKMLSNLKNSSSLTNDWTCNRCWSDPDVTSLLYRLANHDSFEKRIAIWCHIRKRLMNLKIARTRWASVQYKHLEHKMLRFCYTAAFMRRHFCLEQFSIDYRIRLLRLVIGLKFSPQ